MLNEQCEPVCMVSNLRVLPVRPLRPPHDRSLRRVNTVPLEGKDQYTTHLRFLKR